MDDVCRADVRFMPLQCSHESLCEASNEVFKRFAGLGKFFLLDTKSLNANQFTEMVLHLLYEMEFLPAIEVEKVESYTG